MQFDLPLELEDPIEIGDFVEPKWLFNVETLKRQILTDWPGWSTAEELVRGIITPAMAMTQFNKLAAGADTGYYISALFNPHRFSTQQGKLKDIVSASREYESFRNSSARLLSTMQPYGDAHPSTFPKKLAIGTGGVGVCAEFRPILAVQLYRRFCFADSRVLDPCHGWGGRVIGFLAADIEGCHYVGYDPSTRTHAGLVKLIDFLSQAQSRATAEVHLSAYEDAKLEANSFDFALTSPPYFDTEKYSRDEGDSAMRYATIEKWIKGFYKPLIVKTMSALKSDCSFILNVGTNKYDLVKPAKEIAASIKCATTTLDDMIIERSTGARGNANQTEVKRETFLKITKP